jgi:hypothetical protein
MFRTKLHRGRPMEGSAPAPQFESGVPAQQHRRSDRRPAHDVPGGPPARRSLGAKAAQMANRAAAKVLDATAGSSYTHGVPPANQRQHSETSALPQSRSRYLTAEQQHQRDISAHKAVDSLDGHIQQQIQLAREMATQLGHDPEMAAYHENLRQREPNQLVQTVEKLLIRYQTQDSATAYAKQMAASAGDEARRLGHDPQVAANQEWQRQIEPGKWAQTCQHYKQHHSAVNEQIKAESVAQQTVDQILGSTGRAPISDRSTFGVAAVSIGAGVMSVLAALSGG